MIWLTNTVPAHRWYSIRYALELLDQHAFELGIAERPPPSNRAQQQVLADIKNSVVGLVLPSIATGGA